MNEKKKSNNKKFKVTKENLAESLKKANQLRAWIAFELTIVEQAINNTNLSKVLASTYASHTAKLIVSDVINSTILNIRKLTEFLRSTYEYMQVNNNKEELIKIHKQQVSVNNNIICIDGSKGTGEEKPLDECQDKIKKSILQGRLQKIQENDKKFHKLYKEFITKWNALDAKGKELCKNFSEHYEVCIKLWKIRNIRAHFSLEKEEILNIKELIGYSNELTKCMELINLIIRNASYDYEKEHEQDKRSADEFWNLLTKLKIATTV